MELSNLKIIVTGGASGMGRYFVERLAEAGAAVAAGDVNEAGLNTLPSRIQRRKLDVSQEADCQAFVAWAAEALGGLCGLINNAGILQDGMLVKKDKATGKAVRLPTAQWQRVLDINLTGATFMAREVLVWMVDHDVRPGVVVNMSSAARHGNFGQSNYTAAKAALAANTFTWAREWGRFGVRAVAIAPGMIETPMTKGMQPKALEELVSRIPVGRIGQPEDIWKAVRFAIECDYMNGRCIDVDGGLAM